MSLAIRNSESFMGRNRLYIILTLTLIGPSDNLNRQGRSFFFSKVTAGQFSTRPEPGFHRKLAGIRPELAKIGFKMVENGLKLGLKRARNGLKLSKDKFDTPILNMSHTFFIFLIFPLTLDFNFSFTTK